MNEIWTPSISESGKIIGYKDLPIFHGLWNTLSLIEKNWKPRDLNEVLDKWGQLLQSKMHYDGVNYAIFKSFPIDEPDGNFLDKIDINSLKISDWQRQALWKLINKLIEQYPEDPLIDILKNLQKSINSWNTEEIVESIIESTTLQRIIMVDGEITSAWEKFYNGKDIEWILNWWIWNCKTLSVMSKMVLEWANIKYKLGIKRIDIIQNNELHVLLKIYTQKSVFLYDPTSIFYKK